LAKLFGDAGTDEATVNRVTHENAMKHYSFDPFKIRPREQCTAGALRAEATDVDVVTHVGRLADERDIAGWKALTSRGRPVAATK
jgi:hypothetical protein